MRISVIIPAINEERDLPRTLESVFRVDGVEAIVADGGSRDQTVEIALRSGARVVASERGRARQMNEGARHAGGEILLFLHADTRLPPAFDRYVFRILDTPRVAAGAFRLRIGAAGALFRMVERMANFRSAYLGLPYGDQGLFLKADLFRRVGGFPELPIMEDLVFVRLLRRYGRVHTAPAAAVTSARRWLRFGVFRVTLINQLMLTGYALGVSPERLARWYRCGGVRKPRRSGFPWPGD